MRFVAWVFFFQAEDGIRDLVRSRGLGDVYKRQAQQRRPQPFRRQDPQALRRQPQAHADRLDRPLPDLSLIHI